MPRTLVEVTRVVSSLEPIAPSAQAAASAVHIERHDALLREVLEFFQH